MEEKKKLKFSIVTVLAIFVLVFSLINLGERSTAFNTFSVVVSILGITGGITYFLKHTYAPKILYTWLLLQIIIIKPYYFVNQFPTINFMGTVAGLQAGLNLLPLLIFGLVKLVLALTKKRVV